MVAALVFGIVWRYAQMSGHVCRASIRTLATRLGLHRTTIMRALQTLLDCRLVEDLTPSLCNRPHRLRPTPLALQLIATPAAGLVVAPGDGTSRQDALPVAQSDSGSCAKRHPLVAASDTYKTLLKPTIKDEEQDDPMATFYQEKVFYVNQQVLAFYRCKRILHCRFQSLSGSRVLISQSVYSASSTD